MDALTLLQDLLRVDSTNPPGDEEAATELLEAALSGAGLKCDILTSPGGRTNLVARIEGPTDRSALVLLSHTDVVKVERDSWSRDPFGGEIADGHVWGRGALDMKGIGAMHAAAAMELAKSGATIKREVIVVAVSDEETGGAEGAGWLVEEHPDAVGLGEGRRPPEVLGEGAYGLAGVLDRPVFPIVLGEKSSLWVDLHARGEPGHGSIPPQTQAPRNLARLLAEVDTHGPPRVHPVMREQFRRLGESSTGAQAGAFRALGSGAGPVAIKALAGKLRAASGAMGALISDTASLTILDAGYQHNVVPGEAHAALDIRLLPDTDADSYLDDLKKRAARHDIDVAAKPPITGPVSERGPLYEVLERGSEQIAPGCVVVPSLCPGMTDVRYFRARGAIGYGWVPLVLDRSLLDTIHGHDERVPIEAFVDGVEAMTNVVALATT